MTTILGASQYLTASRLATSQGTSVASSNNVLGELDTASGLLSVGRRINRSGIGLSGSARQQIDSYLSSTASTSNALFSNTIGTTSTVEALQQKILAIRATKSEDQLAPSLRGQQVDEEV